MKVTTRDEAYRLGSKIYFTGKECKRGHTAQRYVCNGMCVECTSENTKKYSANGSDRKES